MIRSLCMLVAAPTALVLVLGFGGGIHAAGDSLSLLRPLLVPALGAVSAILVFLGARRVAAAGLALAIGAGISLVPPVPVSALGDRSEVYGLYTKNLLFRLPGTSPVAEDIVASGADFVALQELHQRNRPILSELRSSYPYQHFCPFAAVGGIAVLSRYPGIEGRMVCAEGSGLAAFEVNTPSGPLWVASIHLHWPYPYRQADQIDALGPIFQQFDGPVVLGGDFNMVAWSHAVRSIAEATGTRLSGHAGGTLKLTYHTGSLNLSGLLPRLPIDHVLIPETALPVSVERRDRLGSDHHGVLAHFALGPTS